MVMSQPLVSLLKSQLTPNPTEPAASDLVPAGVLAPLFFKGRRPICSLPSAPSR